MSVWILSLVILALVLTADPVSRAGLPYAAVTADRGYCTCGLVEGPA
jgi:hypothetical protein